MQNFITAIPRLILLLPVLLLAACASAGLALLNSSAGGGYRTTEAAYGPGPLQRIDFYLPDRPLAGRDVVVFYFGGRWQSGAKEDFEFVGAALARRGYLVAIPDFRKYPDVRFPDFVEDAASALAYVDDNAENYGGSNRRIHLLGHSSGAHMAALVTADERYLKRHGKDAYKVIRSYAGLAGPYAFTPDEPDLIDMFGSPENYPQMQVTSFIGGNEPPMLLLYGQEDDSVEPYNHQRLAAKIADKGGSVRVLTYPGLGHIGIITTFSQLGPDTSVVDDLDRFFQGHE